MQLLQQEGVKLKTRVPGARVWKVGKGSGCKECQEGVNDNSRMESSNGTTPHNNSEVFDKKTISGSDRGLGPVSWLFWGSAVLASCGGL